MMSNSGLGGGETAAFADATAPPLRNAPPPLWIVIFFWLLYLAPLMSFPWWPNNHTGRNISFLCTGFEIVLGWAFIYFFDRTRVDPFAWSGGVVALVMLLGLSTSRVVMVRCALQVPRPAFWASEELVYYIAFIGYSEELWYRGIWFEQFPGHRGRAVAVSSVLFGLTHVEHGAAAIIFTGLIGVALGLTRIKGASVLALAVAHGVIDFLASDVMPGIAPRFSLSGSVAAWLGMYSLTLTAICLAGSARVHSRRPRL